MKTEYLKHDFYVTNEFLFRNEVKPNEIIHEGLYKDIFRKLLPKLLFDGEHIISISNKQYDIGEQDLCIRTIASVTKIIRCKNCANKDSCKNYQFFGDDGFCSWGE